MWGLYSILYAVCIRISVYKLTDYIHIMPGNIGNGTEAETEDLT